MKLTKEEQEALNAWLTLRQDLIEGKPVNLKLMARKDELMRKLDKESPVFTQINMHRNAGNVKQRYNWSNDLTSVT